MGGGGEASHSLSLDGGGRTRFPAPLVAVVQLLEELVQDWGGGSRDIRTMYYQRGYSDVS